MSEAALNTGGKRRLTAGGLAFPAAICVIGALPLVFTSSYWLSVLTLCALNVVLALGLNLILGYAGQLNLGYSAFYGIGAYVATLLIKLAGVEYWLALLCGGVAAGIAGVGLAMFAVRLKGHYLGIASLGFALVTYEILMNWVSLTQGPLGIYGVLPPPPIDIPGVVRITFVGSRPFFYLVSAVALVVYVLLNNLVRSPIGDNLRAIREDEVSAASLGINTAAWKIFAFGIGSMIAGVAGCLYASFVGTLVPDAFFITESFTILAMVIVGGLASMPGAVAGAILLTVLPEALRSIGDLRLVIYGLAMTLVVLFIPGGLMQAWTALRARWSRGPA
jgi:branched-chain amino acid transport system permease protein